MPVTDYYTVGGELLGEKTSGGSRTDYLTDALGSVVATVNPGAQVLNTYRYKPYGAQLAKTGVGADPAFRWVGSLGYRQTGKKYSDVYVRARHYDTMSGRYTTGDAVTAHSSEVCAFVPADRPPTERMDPSGGVRARLPICNGNAPWRTRGGRWPAMDPAYGCYAKACQKWDRRNREVDRLGEGMCGGGAYPWNIVVCTVANMGLDGITPRDECYHDCYTTGGSELNAPGTGSMCCIECNKRVCCWVTRPLHRINDATRDLELLACYNQFHRR